jgi:glyoxylase-like metal-dependent hydrolase (beta-lactamase superfamily II)
MRIYPLSEGSFTIDHTKVFVPFDTAIENLQHRPKGSILVEIQPFVVVTDNDIILFDTGLGYHNKEGILQLHDNLMKNGIDPSSVTKVFMSHLHKDHAGGISYIHPQHKERFISFPYAKYYIQQREFDLAMSGPTASYLAEQVQILADYSGVVWLQDNEGVIDNTIHYQLTGGHSLYHQVAWIKENDTIFFFGGDEAPQLQQMKSKFIAKYDMDGKKAMEWRQKWWELGATENWTFAFYHDIQSPTFLHKLPTKNN